MFMRVKLIFTQINTWNLFLKNENPPNVVVAKPQRVGDAIYAILASRMFRRKSIVMERGEGSG
jgi:hypothetical protein